MNATGIDLPRILAEVSRRDGVVARCSCGLEYDADGWAGLHRVGVQSGFGILPDAELRDCTCGSTIVDLATTAAVEAADEDLGRGPW
jgi:hypothetical protein